MAAACSLALLAAGCGGEEEEGPDGSTGKGGTDSSLPDGPGGAGGGADVVSIEAPPAADAGPDAPATVVDAPAADAAPGAEVGPDAAVAGDASGDLPGAADAAVEAAVEAPAPVLTYPQFVSEAKTLSERRLLDCFKIPLGGAGSLLADEDLAEIPLALAAGVATFDPVAGAACLKLITESSCADLAVRGVLAVCNAAVKGNAGTEGFCLLDDNCADPNNHCADLDQTVCTKGCRSRRPKDDGCDPGFDPCQPGLYCKPPANPETGASTCAPLSTQGGACVLSEACAPGTYCKWSDESQQSGTCETIAPDVACTGGWQCASPYVCVAGKCGVGVVAGEACQIQGDPESDFSSCAPSLHCYLQVDKPRCGVGAVANASCGTVEENEVVVGVVPCAPGLFCKDLGEELGGRCQPRGEEGADCADDGECEAGLTCSAGKCGRSQIAVGDACRTDSEGVRCTPGSYCKPTGGTDGDTGVCTAYIATGGSCSTGPGKQCGPTGRCDQGTCKVCSFK